jgi:hypothetical protein
MSRQSNFFAHSLDTEGLHAWLLSEFPELLVIPRIVGRPEELEPIPAITALSGKETMFLVPMWARGRVVLEQYAEGWRAEAGQSLLRQRVSPVIEYKPSVWNEVGRKVWLGRLYWQYGGEVAENERRQLDRMFRWIRSRTVPVPPHGTYRIFPEAAGTAHVLIGWDEVERVNPLLEQMALGA